VCNIESAINALAASAGVLTEWVDVWGTPQQVTTDDLLASLEALTEQPLDSAAAINNARSELEADKTGIEPVVVAWDGELPLVARHGTKGAAHIVTESGAEVPVPSVGDNLRLGLRLPLGYHRLLIGSGPTTLVISAPVKAHPAPSRAFGLVAPVYSLRSEHGDTGIGHYGHLGELADTSLVVGTAVVGTLPLVATFPDQPSPYSPASRRAWNELLVDLTAAPGWNGELPVGSRDPAWVDYVETGDAMRRAIASYAKNTRQLPQIYGRIQRFGADNPEIARYSEFRALADKHGRNWRAWPQDREPSPDRVNYHITGQWLAATQLQTLGDRLRSRGQYLYLDLPIGCHPDGYDIWDQPELYAAASVGAPPDSLFLGGQDWGLPAVIPQRARRDGHQAFIKAIRHQLSVAGLLRIDHVMGLHRIWWVPHGLSATQGAYVMQPTEEMMAIVCLESHRAGAAVVGENLGTVPPAVSEALDTHRLLGMKVAQDGLDTPTPDEVVALSTHDTPPFAAWWKCIDVDDGEDLGVYADGRGDAARSARADTIAYLEEILGTTGLEETRNGILSWMASSPAAIALVNVDDLWAEERRQNVPGTDSERPNWRPRHIMTTEAFAADKSIRRHLEHLDELRTTIPDESRQETDHVGDVTGDNH
jgi:4-alpha-glucanotransferase